MGEFGPPEISGQGSHYGLHHGYWDYKGMHEDENTIVI